MAFTRVSLYQSPYKQKALLTSAFCLYGDYDKLLFNNLKSLLSCSSLKLNNI